MAALPCKANYLTGEMLAPGTCVVKMRLLRSVADPDIFLEGHSHVADPDIRLGWGNLICFSVSHVNFFGGGPKSIAKLDGCHGLMCHPLDPQLAEVVDVKCVSYMYTIIVC